MVIQLPNPLLLPQSYGMGEVAGMSFGSNYTVMMQIGYAHYAPRILKEMEKNPDKPFYDAPSFIKFQKELLVYSDQSIKNTMDRVLAMPDTIIKAIFDKLGDFIFQGEIDETGTKSGINLTGGAVIQVRLDSGQATRRETDRQSRDRSDDAQSPFDRDIERHQEKSQQERHEEIKLTKKKQLTIYIQQNPLPKGPRSDPRGWHLRRAMGANFMNKPAAQLNFSYQRVAYSNGQRRASQSSNLNYAALNKKLAFYSSALNHDRNSAQFDLVIIKKTWLLMVEYSVSIFDWRDFYIGTK